MGGIDEAGTWEKAWPGPGASKKWHGWTLAPQVSLELITRASKLATRAGAITLGLNLLKQQRQVEHAAAAPLLADTPPWEMQECPTVEGPTVIEGAGEFSAYRQAYSIAAVAGVDLLTAAHLMARMHSGETFRAHGIVFVAGTR